MLHCGKAVDDALLVPSDAFWKKEGQRQVIGMINSVDYLEPSSDFLCDSPASCQLTSDWRRRWAPPAGRSPEPTVDPAGNTTASKNNFISWSLI